MSEVSDDQVAAVRSYIEINGDAWLADLVEWLRIPSISTDPEYEADVRDSAEWLAQALRDIGVPTVQVLTGIGAPAVYCHWPSENPNAPTVLVYGHHDVQPVVPLEAWVNPPFTPMIAGDELRARGAADDKGQVAFHLLGLAAHVASRDAEAPAVNIKFLIEGEEETGSPNFQRLLREHADLLACDLIVVSDTTMFSKDVPSICLSMRGLLTAEITATGSVVDMHSGVFGGAVPNPLHALARLVADFHDADGRVTVPGFYDGVDEPSAFVRQMFQSLPFDEAAWLRDTARAEAAVGEAGYSTLERLGVRPTLEINGMWGGYTGAGDKTIIPAVAHAKLSCRLVGRQDPERITSALRQHIVSSAPEGIDFDFTFHSATRPVSIPADHPAVSAARAAMGRAFGTEITFTAEGGSGPHADFVDILGAPVVFVGVATPDDGFHAPNERARISLLRKGAESVAYLWTELAPTP